LIRAIPEALNIAYLDAGLILPSDMYFAPFCHRNNGSDYPIIHEEIDGRMPEGLL
jgi:hypothetical protein